MKTIVLKTIPWGQHAVLARTIVLFTAFLLTACGSPQASDKGSPNTGLTPYREDYRPEDTQRAAAGRDTPAAMQQEGQALFGPRGAGGAADGAASWQIVLAAFGGADGQRLAEIAVAEAHQIGLTSAYAEPRGKAWVVAYGRYESGASTRAQEDLKRLKGLEINGRLPFAGAVLAPPPVEAIAGSVPDHDLATVRVRYGRSAYYTLQVGIYRRMDDRDPTPQDLADFRKAAEAAVIQLRREGQEAFYYHTSRSSTVTVGIFSEKDYDTSRKRPDGSVTTGPARESFRLREAKEKNPHNLVNGQAVKVRGAIQPSLLVPIPN